MVQSNSSFLNFDFEWQVKMPKDFEYFLKNSNKNKKTIYS